MPRVEVNGIGLSYDVRGQGEPLLMIHGLGHSVHSWFAQLPYLSQRFRTVAYDCRGVGGSDRPASPYEIADDAGDAVGLLDALGIERAHLIAVSRGGYIAQEIAIRHPERVARLALIVTHAGGPEYLAATKPLWDEILDVRGLTAEQIFRKAAQFSTAPEFFETRPDMVEAIVAARMASLQPASAFRRQFDSAAAFDARERIGQIQAPCLVVAGEKDRIVPLPFVKALAAGIPGARLEIVRGAAHLVHVEKADQVNGMVVDFLQGAG
jgi:pimeloyl-ACP methyl ester carboxylesterase